MEFLSAFKAPKAALPVIGSIVSPEEGLLVEALSSEAFTADDARAALEAKTGEPWPASRTGPLLHAAYERAALDLEDETFTKFRLGDFYGLRHPAASRGLEPEERHRSKAVSIDHTAARASSTTSLTSATRSR